MVGLFLHADVYHHAYQMMYLESTYGESEKFKLDKDF